MSNASNDTYKPNYFYKLLAITLFIISSSIFVLFFIDPNNCIIKTVYSVLEKSEDNSTRLNLEEIMSIILLIFFILDYIILNVVLLLLIVKDDGGIRFAKLNELKRVQEVSNSFVNSYEVKEETLLYYKNGADKKIVNKKENPNLEFQKKYMDTIAEI